jgi:hypothetical protein
VTVGHVLDLSDRIVGEDAEYLDELVAVIENARDTINVAQRDVSALHGLGASALAVIAPGGIPKS